MTYLVPPSVLPGNILSLADSDFESGSPTWAAETNASSTGVVSTYAFSGVKSFSWIATAAGDTYIQTGFYRCVGGQGYDVSGLALSPNAGHDLYIGVNWYAGASLISTSTGADTPTNANVWQPVNGAFASPPTATQFKLFVWFSTNVLINEPFAIDLMYAAETDVQILIDWINPAFSTASQAGSSFFDVTPWIRLQDGVTMNRGRQNGIAEITAGSASFALQNDTGWFTKYNSASPCAILGGNPDLGGRCQINADDQTGAFWTRFDGPISEIDYAIDSTGNTNIASVAMTDVMAFMNRQTSLQCWTKQAVIGSVPWLHWTLNDNNNAGSLGNAAETSGNNGPALHAVTVTSQVCSIGWRNSNGGVETLADAAKPGQPDMSEYWPAGSVVSSGVSALDPGSVGPYTTPLPSAYFTPYIGTPGSAANNFVNNPGYALTGQLTAQVGTVNTITGSYTLEAWFCMDPAIQANIAAKLGPYTVLSLGSSRTGSTLCIGVYIANPYLNLEAAVYSQPPAFAMNNWAQTPVATTSFAVHLSNDTVPLPHHFAATITGGVTSNAILELYVDGADCGSIALPNGANYDTVCIGGAFGGWGNFYGNIQLVSIYNRILPLSEIYQHATLGQVGMWESTTDNCVYQLGQYAQIPQFWNALTNQSNGLSLVDYYDITNATALASMQIFESVEQGLLYCTPGGALSFATRDWRMGYGAPDIQLPPDVYTAQLGYQIIDQYIVNGAAISTATYQQGVATSSPVSALQYGAYSNGTALSPIQLPLITWNRAYGQLGLTPYYYWPDPQLNDNIAWQVNSKSSPRLTFGSLTLDLLTLDPTSGVTISQLYGVDINNMVSLLTYDRMVLATSPVCYYPLDGGSGVDLTGNSGTLVQSPAGAAVFGANPSPVVSSPSCAYIVSGVNGVLTSTYRPAGGSTWTVECWVNLDGLTQTGNPRVFNSSHTSSDNTGFEIFLSGGNTPNVAFGNGSSYGLVNSGSVLGATGWHYVAATWAFGAVNVYIDGQPSGAASLSGTLGTSLGTVTIGGPATYSSDYFTGLVGQCVITQSALTSAQILARYNAAKNGVPASLANAVNANELFVEGVNETLSLSARTLTYYTSPASTQRAWRAGDPVYGQLGVTSRVGISQPDLSTPPALGKDVAHDASGPYWPPQIGGVLATGTYGVGYVNFAGTSGTLTTNTGLGRSNQGDCLFLEIECAATSTITVTDAEGNTYVQTAALSITGMTQYIFTSVGAAPLNSADTLTITGTVNQTYSCALFGLQNVLAVDAAPVYNSGTSTTPSVTGGTMSATSDLQVVATFNNSSLGSGIGGAWTLFAQNLSGTMRGNLYYLSATSTAANAYAGVFTSSVAWGAIALSFTVQPSVLNNPINNGHQFIGALEMRGLANTLQTVLQPPITVVAQVSHGQSMPSGSNANPVITMDNIFADTICGMSAVPGWSNWYTCLQAGFYDISVAMLYTLHASGASQCREGYITVAQKAAQAVAAGTATPLTIIAYVCPIGECHQSNNYSINPVMAASTRIYLGLGDMVSLCTTQNQGTNDTTGSNYGGSMMSIRFAGYSTVNDQVMIDSTIGSGTNSVTQGGTGSSGPSQPRLYTRSYSGTASYAYAGKSTLTPQLKVTSGNSYQGENPGGQANGSYFSFIVFPMASLRTAISGATVKSITLTCTNVSSWYKTGAALIIGYSIRSSFPTTGVTLSRLSSGDYPNMQQMAFSRGQTKSITLTGSWTTNFLSLGTCVLIGNQATTNVKYAGQWGAPSTWSITVTYTK